MAKEKDALRERVLALRDAMTPEARRLQSARLYAKIRARADWLQSQTVMLYLGIRSEWDPAPLVDEALKGGKRVILPRIIKEPRHLEIREVKDLALDLSPGAWGLREPDPSRCPEVDPAELDFILVPGVAFDRECQRLGYGAGYYDRLLADPRMHAVTVAAAFLEQFVDKIPAEPHDKPVDHLVWPDDERLPR